MKYHIWYAYHTRPYDTIPLWYVLYCILRVVIRIVGIFWLPITDLITITSHPRWGRCNNNIKIRNIRRKNGSDHVTKTEIMHRASTKTWAMRSCLVPVNARSKGSKIRWHDVWMSITQFKFRFVFPFFSSSNILFIYDTLWATFEKSSRPKNV